MAVDSRTAEKAGPMGPHAVVASRAAEEEEEEVVVVVVVVAAVSQAQVAVDSQAPVVVVVAEASQAAEEAGPMAPRVVVASRAAGRHLLRLRAHCHPPLLHSVGVHFRHHLVVAVAVANGAMRPSARRARR